MEIMRVATVYEPEADALPAEFRDVLTEQDVAAIRTGPEYFAELAGRDSPKWLRNVLAEASYSEQWLSCLSDLATADAAICVFEPNRVASPESRSLDYCGSFTYDL